MSLTIDQIRSVTQDKAAHVFETVSFDGAATAFKLGYYPIVTVSIDITPAPDTIDYDKGVISYNAAPGSADVACSYDTVLLSDQDIQNIMDIQNSIASGGNADPRVILAAVIDAIANNQALILKKIEIEDLQTDGSVVAKSLRDYAESLRKQVYDPAYQEAVFDIIEEINDVPGFREKVIKDIYRDSF